VEKALSLFERLEADQDFKIERSPSPLLSSCCSACAHSCPSPPPKKRQSYRPPKDDDESDEEVEEEQDDAKEDTNDENKLKKSSWFHLPPIRKPNEAKAAEGQLSSHSSKTGTGIGAPFNPYYHLRVLLAKK
jgi:hypothetical protein